MNDGGPVPRLVIAGERSGVGKSTITVGILLALKQRGLNPQPFKSGPDFLDPMHHQAVVCQPSYNLDTWMFGDEVVNSFMRGSRRAGISVIEGVMGLYDGLDGRSEEGSTAHLAKMLQAPVVLIVDASSSARSAGAVALGFQMYDPAVNLAGVIFNNVAGRGHLEMLADSLRGLECIGGIPTERAVELKSRHLGLIPAQEDPDTRRYERICDLVEENLDMDRLVAVARSAPPLPKMEEAEPIQSTRTRIGLAWDEAFNFYYQENLERLQGLGAELVPFSPLRDPLPDVDGLYFGGGYPELFAEGLESNTALRRHVRDASSSGMPIYAECGGMMYACDSLVDLDDKRRSMTGIFDAEVEMTKCLEAIGYVEVEANMDNVMSQRGWYTRGHEFHFSRVASMGNETLAYNMLRGKGIIGGRDGLVAHDTVASYTHLHFASCPRYAQRFVEACSEWRK